MKTITGKLNFLLRPYSFQDFLRQMDIHDCEVIDIKRSFTSYIVAVRGTDENLDHARWFFRHYGSILS